MATQLKQLLSELRARIREISPEQAHAEPGVVYLDVREAEELASGVIPGSIPISRGFLELEVEEALPNKDAPIVVYCAGGTRSVFAAASLGTLGYRNVRSLSGGYAGWKERGFLTEVPVRLGAAERARYARHLVVSEIGEAGQLKLIQGRVLIIGAGGLGSPAAFYLAAAGVGKIGIVDFDVIEESNLQRQILHKAADVGKPKIDSALRTISEFNPLVSVQTYGERLDPTNVERIFTDYDVVVDASDNFQTRYLVNDAGYRLGKPLVHGSILSFEGNLTVFDFRGPSPCYRCLYASRPSEGFAPNCTEAGVLGVLPGIIGTLQAAEAIKLLLGIGRSLAGRFLHYDALSGEFDEFEIHKDPNCEVCALPPSRVRYRSPEEETCQR